MSTRAINLYSGLPCFRVRSPTGLLPDYNEFATLKTHLLVIGGGGGGAASIGALGSGGGGAAGDFGGDAAGGLLGAFLPLLLLLLHAGTRLLCHDT